MILYVSSVHALKDEMKADSICVLFMSEEGDRIGAAQILFSKKWISSTAVENMEPEKIEKARQSAIRFLSKC